MHNNKGFFATPRETVAVEDDDEGERTTTERGQNEVSVVTINGDVEFVGSSLVVAAELLIP